MAAGKIILPPDSTGSAVQGWVNTIGADSVYTMAHVITTTGGDAVVSGNGVYVHGVQVHGDPDGGGPVKIGGFASSTPPAAVSEGDRVNAWYSLSGAAVVDGGVLHDAVDSGNPIKIGGKAVEAAIPTIVSATGDRVNAWFDSFGSLSVNTAFPDATADSVGNANGGLLNNYFGGASVGVHLSVRPSMFNGTTWDRMRGNTNGQFVQGNVAHDAVDAGFPIKMGGKASNTAGPSGVANLDRVDMLFDLFGRPGISLGSLGSGSDAVANSNSHAQPLAFGNSSPVSFVPVANNVYNGSSWDRQRGTTLGTYAIGGVAHDGVDDASGPVRIGGLAKTTVTAVANNDRVNGLFDAYGRLSVAGVGAFAATDAFSNSSFTALASHGDTSLTTTRLHGSGDHVFNGSTWDRMRGDTLGTYVQGHLAHDAVDAGNPIKVGGKAISSAFPTLVGNNDRVNANFDGYGRQTINLGEAVTAADALANTLMVAPVGHAGTASSALLTANMLYNGSTWDRMRGAVTLADALANPGVGLAQGQNFLMGYNGSTWDRVRTANTGRLQVDVITGGGGGTQYVEDVAFAGNGTGTLVVARRDDALSTLTPVADDAVGLRVNAQGALWINEQISYVVSDTKASTGAMATLDVTNAQTVIVEMLGDGGGLTYSFVGDSTGITTPLVAMDLVSGTFNNQGSGNGNWLVNVAGYDRFYVYIDSISSGTASVSYTSGKAAYMPQVDTRVDAMKAINGLVGLATSNGTTWDHWRSANGDGQAATGLAAAATMMYNGSTWDRIRGSTTDGLLVNLGTNNDVLVSGMAAHDATIAGNPITVGGRSNDALPTEVTADGEAVWAWFLRNGAQMMATIPSLGMIGDPYTLTSKTVTATTTQTGTVVWTPASGKRLVITYYQIQIGGTTAGTVQLWFEAADSDTTYTRGTDFAIFDGEFAPSATSKPGIVNSYTPGWIGQNVDRDLRYTTSANMTITITVWGYEI